MLITAKPSHIAFAADVIRKPGTPPSRKRVAAIVEDAAKVGWVPMYRIEDLIQASGCFGWYFGAAETCDLFNAPRQSVYRRPTTTASTAYGFSEVRAADLAALLITMERYGISVDPLPLVEALRPALKRQAVVTSAELHILWYARERHRLEPVTMAVAELPAVRLLRSDTAITLPTGYRTEVWNGDDGEPCMLVVTKPKRGRARVAA